MRSAKIKKIKPDTEECLTVNEHTTYIPNASELDACPTTKLLKCQFLKTDRYI